MDSSGRECLKIDRIAPSRRPEARVAGYQRWRSLLFMHWAVPVEVLRGLVPASLELDLWEDKAYLGIVPFEMQDVRPWWWPRACAMNFLETNLRTYVMHDRRPGIYFFSLEATSRLAVWGARVGWGLPYYYAHAQVKRAGDEVEYVTRRPHGGPSHSVRYRVGEELGSSQPGTLQHFLLERYLLFVTRGGKTYSGQVHHVPYPAFGAQALDVQDELIAAAGFPAVTTPPALTHFSPGVDVEIFPLVRVA